MNWIWNPEFEALRVSAAQKYFHTVNVLRFSFNDIFNIYQHKNTKVSLITQQYDRFILGTSVLIISPSILRNNVFLSGFNSRRLMKSIVLWADVVSSTTVFGCLLSVGFIPFQIAAGHRKLNPNATISDKKRLFIACDCKMWSCSFNVVFPRICGWAYLIWNHLSENTESSSINIECVCV